MRQTGDSNGQGPETQRPRAQEAQGSEEAGRDTGVRIHQAASAQEAAAKVRRQMIASVRDNPRPTGSPPLPRPIRNARDVTTRRMFLKYATLGAGAIAGGFGLPALAADARPLIDGVAA